MMGKQIFVRGICGVHTRTLATLHSLPLGCDVVIEHELGL